MGLDILLEAFLYIRQLKTKKKKVDGYIQAAFNDMHGTNHLHSHRSQKVNDNKYHVVKFRIHEFNSSLTVDDQHAQKQIIGEKCEFMKKYFI